jgi:hypothetical protein
MHNAKKYARVTKQAVLAVSSDTFFYGCVLDDDQVPSPLFSCPWHSIPYFCGAVVSCYMDLHARGGRKQEPK